MTSYGHAGGGVVELATNSNPGNILEVWATELKHHPFI